MTEQATSQPASARRALSRTASFWVIASVVTLSVWASGAPTMVYPVYYREWHISSVDITTIFALYPISLVLTMVVFGGISDYVGRRITLIAGMSAMAVGVLFFALAQDIGWLYPGRVLQGAGVGLAMSAASAGLVEFNPSSKLSRAASINTAANAVGFGSALVIGGALVQYAPDPEHFAYWMLLAFVLAGIMLLLFLPPNPPGTLAEGRWRPRGIVVPRGLGWIVFVAAFVMTAAYSTGSVMQSLGSQLVETMVGTTNAFVAGIFLAAAPVALASTAILARRVPPKLSIIIGGPICAAGMMFNLAGGLMASAPLFVAGTLLGGCGYGFLFLGGLGLINRWAPVHHRAQTLSVVYLVGFFGQAIIAYFVGLTATNAGLPVAMEIWLSVVGFLCLTGAVLAVAPLRPGRSAATEAITE